MIDLVLFCFGTASLTLFLDMCMEKGMIFRKYYNWITYWLSLDKREVTFTMRGFDVSNIKIRYIYQKNQFVWLWKILGGCSLCFGTWLFICTYLLTIVLLKSVFPYNSFILAVYGILGIGFNYVFIKVIEKI
jgi:hypothetical protein